MRVRLWYGRLNRDGTGIWLLGHGRWDGPSGVHGAWMHRCLGHGADGIGAGVEHGAECEGPISSECLFRYRIMGILMDMVRSMDMAKRIVKVMG
jgi:hypothetical protein